MKNDQDLKKIEEQLREAFGCKMDSRVISEPTTADPGKFTVTFYPRKHASWADLIQMCREVGVDQPANMLVERADNDFCAITLFWGFTG
jgi:hypothetical protein